MTDIFTILKIKKISIKNCLRLISSRNYVITVGALRPVNFGSWLISKAICINGSKV